MADVMDEVKLWADSHLRHNGAMHYAVERDSPDGSDVARQSLYQEALWRQLLQNLPQHLGNGHPYLIQVRQTERPIENFLVPWSGVRGKCIGLDLHLAPFAWTSPRHLQKALIKALADKANPVAQAVAEAEDVAREHGDSGALRALALLRDLLAQRGIVV